MSCIDFFFLSTAMNILFKNFLFFLSKYNGSYVVSNSRSFGTADLIDTSFIYGSYFLSFFLRKAAETYVKSTFKNTSIKTKD